jgi:hypothetical protein
MKNLVKISRENLKSLNGGSMGAACPENPSIIRCYVGGSVNGICLTKYQCCVALGDTPEHCREDLDNL